MLQTLQYLHVRHGRWYMLGPEIGGKASVEAPQDVHEAMCMLSGPSSANSSSPRLGQGDNLQLDPVLNGQAITSVCMHGRDFHVAVFFGALPCNRLS